MGFAVTLPCPHLTKSMFKKIMKPVHRKSIILNNAFVGISQIILSLLLVVQAINLDALCTNPILNETKHKALKVVDKFIVL